MENEIIENKVDETTVPPVSVEEPKQEVIIPTASEDAELLAERARREGAEKKIVELKRKFKEAGFEENPDVNELVEEALNKKIDALKAIATANEAKLAKENSELRMALKSKNSIANGTVSSNQDKPVFEEEPVLSEMDKKILARHGLTYKDIK